MKIKIDVWNMVNGNDCPLVVNLTRDDIERLAMEKARSFFEHDAKVSQEVRSINVEF